MLGLSGTLSCALFVYLCICVFVFVYETLGKVSFEILGPRAFRKCLVCMVYTIIQLRQARSEIFKFGPKLSKN